MTRVMVYDTILQYPENSISLAALPLLGYRLWHQTSTAYLSNTATSPIDILVP